MVLPSRPGGSTGGSSVPADGSLVVRISVKDTFFCFLCLVFFRLRERESVPTNMQMKVGERYGSSKLMRDTYSGDGGGGVRA